MIGFPNLNVPQTFRKSYLTLNKAVRQFSFLVIKFVTFKVKLICLSIH